MERPAVAGPSGRTANYGAPISASTKGNFPAIGSTLGPYFSIGRLGFGTFCSIHKCVNLDYHHNRRKKKPRKGLRLVAAKVEIGEFKNSGVLGGEASILHFLDDVLPPRTVPTYMGHYMSTDRDKFNKTATSAIVMEYLTGQDMHKIREWSTKHQFKLQQQQQQDQQQEQERPQFSPQHTRNEDDDNNYNGNTSNAKASLTGRPRRRIAVNDAVYLTAHVMLPLLRKMHSVGIIHRDVKPSNVVKRSDNVFCMVDFGLSKSIVVPQNSELANPNELWKGSHWMRSSPGSSTGFPKFELLSPDVKTTNDSNACYRVERPTADFRGTSMYASVRVHQLKDYAPRDDIWSLLYVFCDLASGGLPWMLHAANKDRAACKLLKERIHGMEPQADGEIGTDTKRLLMGDEYHRALFKKRNGKVDPSMDQEQDDDDDPNLPRPLSLSEDVPKVGLLTEAFEHLKGLGYADIPDYDLIQRAIEGFDEKGDRSGRESPIPLIDWELLSESFKNERANDVASTTKKNTSIPTWTFADKVHQDPLDPSIFSEAEESMKSGNNGEEEGGRLYGEAADLARLPLELRFKVAQMEYNTAHWTTIEAHLAMHDWLAVCLPLLYRPWNSKRYEKGGHRSDDDGYRREFFLKLINKCLNCATKFRGFRDRAIMYDDNNEKDDTKPPQNGTANHQGRKRRRMGANNLHLPSNKSGTEVSSQKSDLLLVSRVLFELRMIKKVEEKLSPPPPIRLSFGS